MTESRFPEVLKSGASKSSKGWTFLISRTLVDMPEIIRHSICAVSFAQ